jgi:phosphoheptose isomerase
MIGMTKLGQAHTVANLENAVYKDRDQTIYSLSVELNVSIYTVHAIALNFVYHKVFSQWVPCLQTHTKEHCLSISLEH